MTQEKTLLERLIPNRSLSFIVLASLTGLFLYAVYSVIFPTYHVRYRLEFVVKDHGQIRTGSAVIGAVYTLTPDFLAMAGGAHVPGGASAVNGFAVNTDLGSRGLLFAALRTYSGDVTGTMGQLPLIAYGLTPPGTFEDSRITLNQLKSKRGWADIPLDCLCMPLLLRFRNINDPMSAEKVDPKNLAATFGKGVELVSVRLELTSDPTTEMPAGWPDWLKSVHETFSQPGYIGGGILSKDSPYGLQSYDFKGTEDG
jgi:hypothetical protein